LRFFGKTTPYAKIFKILFGKFSSRHRFVMLMTPTTTSFVVTDASLARVLLIELRSNVVRFY